MTYQSNQERGGGGGGGGGGGAVNWRKDKTVILVENQEFFLDLG